VELTNETLKSFIEYHLNDEGFITDLGYLLIPDDARLNDEALCNLKLKFRAYAANIKGN